MPREFPRLRHPIVQAPLAGGPSTPALAVTVCQAGGLGFLAAGYRSAEDLRDDIARVREGTSAAFGVNLFALADTPVDEAAVARYAARLRAEGADPGEPRFDDDGFADKLEVACSERPAIVSFTFGCPEASVVDRLHDHEIAVWVTVTEPDEARTAARAGADALVVQGVEAGGHRGSFRDEDGRGELSLLPLLRLTAQLTDLPLVASGGIADGAGVAAALAAGARAVQIGTGFLRSPEAGTSAPHREALAGSGATRLTRAFTGRRARGIVNEFMRRHDADAPSAYPHLHYLTAPVRIAARQAGDLDRINLWAGEAHQLAQEVPAGELVRRWGEEARARLEEARARLEA